MQLCSASRFSNMHIYLQFHQHVRFYPRVCPGFSFHRQNCSNRSDWVRELVLPSLNLNCHHITCSFLIPRIEDRMRDRVLYVIVSKLSIHCNDVVRLFCCRMDHEETRCRLVVDKRSATSLPPHRRRSSLATRSRYVVLQTRNERQVSCVAADTSLTGAIIGGGPVVAAAGPAMRRWARRGCCYPSTPDQRWVIFLSTNIALLGNHSLFPKSEMVFFICRVISCIFFLTHAYFHRNKNVSKYENLI